MTKYLLKFNDSKENYSEKAFFKTRKSALKALKLLKSEANARASLFGTKPAIQYSIKNYKK